MAVGTGMQVDLDDISSERELYGWMATQPAELSRAMAARSALRSLPAVMTRVERMTTNANAGASLVSCLRATIIACVSAQRLDGPSEALIDAAVAATRAAPRMYPSVTDRTATLCAMSAAEAVTCKARASVADAAGQALSLSSDTARSCTLTAGLAPFSSEATVIGDAKAGQDNHGAELFETRLWTTGKAPLPVLEYWEGFSKAARNEPTWTYWVEWYQGFMSGNPVDWELQELVALIDDAIWREGAEAVGIEIERIRTEIAAKAAAAAEAEAAAKAVAAEEQRQLRSAMPASVDHLVANRTIALAVLDGLSAQVELSQSLVASSATISAPLAKMQTGLAQVCTVLRNSAPEVLKQEGILMGMRTQVAHFNMAFQQFETAVLALKHSRADLSAADQKVLTALLNQRALLGSMASGLSVLAGQDQGLQDRYEGFAATWLDLAQVA